MLSLQEVTAGYGKKNVINGITAEFKAARAYVLIGKNGCGKSTILKLCADILPIYSGRISLNGKDLREYTPTERARTISYMAQYRNTPHITVYRLMTHARHPYMSARGKLGKDDICAINAALETMQITEFKDTPLASLSGGERQRVYAAMLLAQDTPILLLDEPTTYMDISYQLAFLSHIPHLTKSGKLIITVLHDINAALGCGDEILVMEDGCVIKSGTPQEIVRSGVLSQVFDIKIEEFCRDGRTFYQAIPK